MATAIDWDTGEQSGLVSIGDHELCLYSYGPDRKPGQPVVICIPGLASSIKYVSFLFRSVDPQACLQCRSNRC